MVWLKVGQIHNPGTRRVYRRESFLPKRTQMLFNAGILEKP